MRSHPHTKACGLPVPPAHAGWPALHCAAWVFLTCLHARRLAWGSCCCRGCREVHKCAPTTTLLRLDQPYNMYKGPHPCCLLDQVAVVQFSNDVRVEVHPRNLPLHELRMRLDHLVRPVCRCSWHFKHAHDVAPAVLAIVHRARCWPTCCACHYRGGWLGAMQKRPGKRGGAHVMRARQGSAPP